MQAKSVVSKRMITLSPRKAFQENEEAVKAFRSLVHSKYFQSAVTQSLAELVTSERITAEELAGAKKYISTLLNIAEPDFPMPEYPVKRLSTVHETRRASPDATSTK
jgi:hypothetical protein